MDAELGGPAAPEQSHTDRRIPGEPSVVPLERGCVDAEATHRADLQRAVDQRGESPPGWDQDRVDDVLARSLSGGAFHRDSGPGLADRLDRDLPRDAGVAVGGLVVEVLELGTVAVEQLSPRADDEDVDRWELVLQCGGGPAGATDHPRTVTRPVGPGNGRRPQSKRTPVHFAWPRATSRGAPHRVRGLSALMATLLGEATGTELLGGGRNVWLMSAGVHLLMILPLIPGRHARPDV